MKHGITPNSNDIEGKILRAGFANVYERKVAERHFIRLRSPDINVMPVK